MYRPSSGVDSGLSVCWTTSVGTRTLGSIARALNPVVSGNDQMLQFAGPPRGDQRRDGIVLDPGAVWGICLTVEDHQRSGARRMCRGKSAVVAMAPGYVTRTASRLPSSSNTAVMLSAHCSTVGSVSGVTGSDAPVPG
jgi:hypothetical protein